ncbi:MAG: hypothetical protein GY866_34005 [Proteobacteria bacterium]|nr:hypothetical protein [Pseudomonadota bacterium]
MPFAYSAGCYTSRFLVEIRDNKKFFGVRCPKCGKVYCPPKKICGPCFQEMKEPVEVGPQGTIRNFTIVRFTFVDPQTGLTKPTPYGYGFLQLDGADSILPHFIAYENEADVKVGARIEAVFKEDRTGSVSDIKHFRLL